MTPELSILFITALTMGMIHAAAGPDHYVPFIALAEAGKWRMRKTILVTLLSGVGHIVSSIVIALLGVAAGIGISKIEALESGRGHIAAWLLIGFGLAYGAWGLVWALRPRAEEHAHEHAHGDGPPHVHWHGHRGPAKHSTSAWVMFIIFVFGPCEPMIPLIMYPAAKGNYLELAVITAVFSLATIGTMLAIVTAGVLGVARLRLAGLERYGHAIAGLSLVLCGGAMEFLGL